MLTVKEVMSTHIISLTPETDIVQAARVLLENRINGAPVVDRNGKLVGIICQSDLVAQQKKIPLPTVFTVLDGIIPLTSPKHWEKQIRKIAAMTVADAMTPNPVTVQAATSIEDVAALMVDRNFHTLPVVEGKRLVGVIGKEDVLRTLIAPTDAHQE